MDNSQYDVFLNILRTNTYPPDITKNRKDALRRRSRDFSLSSDRTRLKTLGKNGRWLDVVRESEAKAVVLACHLEGMHYGSAATRRRVGQDFYLDRSLAGVVKEIVDGCEVCVNRREGLRRVQELRPIEVHGAFERVGIDIMGPFKETPRGNSYIVMATDHFTKWAMAEAIPDKTAATIASFILRHVLRHHGSPLIIQSDQGSEFNNDLVRSITSRSEWRNTAAYRPQTNGLAERTNRTLLDRLASVTNTNVDDWDVHLDPSLWSYCTSYHSSIGMTPFRALYGRDHRSPFNPFGPRDILSDSHLDSSLLVQTHLSTIRRVQDAATSNIEKAQKRQKVSHDRTLRDAVTVGEFEVGQKVDIREPRSKRSRKLASVWTGPHVVVGKHPNTYIIDQLGTRGIPPDRLRLHFLPSPLSSEVGR